MSKKREIKIRSLSPKQQKLVRLVLENLGSKGITKTLRQIMLEAGYSAQTARGAAREIIQSSTVQEALDPYIRELDDKRRLALSHITDKKLKGTNAYSLALINDLLTKNHQLLSGKETGRIGVLDDEEKSRIDALFKKNNS